MCNYKLYLLNYLREITIENGKEIIMKIYKAKTVICN